MTSEMPMILDQPMEMDMEMDAMDGGVDDLFGDPVTLTLPVRLASRGLSGRLDQLQRSSGCVTLAWSKAGTIASITPDGLSLELRYLRCDPKDGSWDIGEPTTCELVKGTRDVPLVHIDWGVTNSPELAVVDAAGRVALLTFAVTLNSPFSQKKFDVEPINSLNAVVATHWLSVSSPLQQSKGYNVMYGPAVKRGNVYSFESSFVHASGPNHPHAPKSALLSVTRSGTIKMYWPQNNNKIEETSKELEIVDSSNDLVTHASVASDRKHLLIAMVTRSGYLRFIKVEIHWTGNGPLAEKTTLPIQTRLNPALVERNTATASWSHFDGLGKLLHILVIPSTLDKEGKNTVGPVIVIIRSQPPINGLLQEQYILERWEAVEQRETLNPAFAQLGNRRNSAVSEMPLRTTLRKLEPIVFGRAPLGIETIHFGKAVVLSFADGSVEFRDRFSFEEIYDKEDTERIMNPRQVGYDFVGATPCHEVAFSPTHCSMVQLSDDGKLQWSKMEYPKEIPDDLNAEYPMSDVLAALALPAASAIFHQHSFDDILAIVRPWAKMMKFQQHWIREMFKILKVNVDFTDEANHDAMMRSSHFHSCLSTLNALGFTGESRPLSFLAKMAHIQLNLRNIAVLVSLSNNALKDKLSPLDEDEVVEALTGCMRWGVDLMSWLTDSLFELMHDREFMACLEDQQLFLGMTSYLQKSNNMCLHLLLCSSARNLLLMLCKRMRHLETVSGQTIDLFRRHSTGAAADAKPVKLPSVRLQLAYQKMHEVITSGLVKTVPFGNLLNTLGSDVKRCYAQFLPLAIKKQYGSRPDPPQGKQLDQMVKDKQVQSEMLIFLGNQPPMPFIPMMKKLFLRDLPALREQTDPGALFFKDFGILDVEDSGRRNRASGDVRVDAFSRKEIRMTPEAKWRRCTRCAAVMADTFGTRPGYAVVLSQQRRCHCGGSWGLLPQGAFMR